MHARGRVVGLFSVSLAVSIFALLSAGASSASSEGPSRIVIPGLTSDSAPALLQCDPANLTPLSFNFKELRQDSTGDGQSAVFDGLVVNRCAQTVTNLTLSASAHDAAGNVLGIVFFHPLFASIPPGGASPFVLAVPDGQTPISRLGLGWLRFSVDTPPGLDLRITTGAVTEGSSGVSVGYELTNAGSAPAAIPKLAGRLQGAGCQQPWAFQYLDDGSPLLPGQKASGSVFIPDNCGGVPELLAGGGPAEAASAPPGLSIRAATVTYLGTTLRLVADVCNNSATNIDQPALRVQFAGPSGTFAANLTATGFYPGLACAPLIAAVPNAPASLKFDRLLPPEAPQMTASYPTPARRAVDPASEVWDPIPDNFEPPKVIIHIWDPWSWLHSLGDAAHAPEPTPEPTPEPATNWWYSADGVNVPVPSLAPQVQAASDAVPILLSIIYNQNPVAISSDQYQILVAGNDAAGVPVAGIQITAPPDLPAFGWGIASTPLTADNVIAPPGVTFFIQPEGFVP